MSGALQVCQAGLCEMRFMCLCHSFALALATVAVPVLLSAGSSPRRPHAARPGLLCAAGLRQLSVSGAPGAPPPGPRLPPLPLRECPAPARGSSLRL